jgi:hypothetical protein
MSLSSGSRPASASSLKVVGVNPSAESFAPRSLHLPKEKSAARRDMQRIL